MQYIKYLALSFLLVFASCGGGDEVADALFDGDDKSKDSGVGSTAVTVTQNGDGSISVDIAGGQTAASGDGSTNTVSDSNNQTSIIEDEEETNERIIACKKCCGDSTDGVTDEECFQENNCLPEDLIGTSCVIND